VFTFANLAFLLGLECNGNSVPTSGNCCHDCDYSCVNCVANC
ncbi:14240_t:CDS:1, partial [Dentiscutata heterogama]